VEVSLISKEWTMIDKRKNDTSFHHPFHKITWNVQPYSPFTYIKIAQTGSRSDGDYKHFHFTFVKFLIVLWTFDFFDFVRNVFQ
jgi:hypothetical protein